MTKKGKQAWIKRFFASRLFLLTSLIVVLLIALGYARAYYQDYKIKQEIRQLEEEVQRLETKKLESLDILKYVTSDDFVEEKARTELNMRRSGEKMVVISREEGDYYKKDQKDESDKHLNNIYKWWYYFTHKQFNN